MLNFVNRKTKKKKKEKQNGIETLPSLKQILQHIGNTFQLLRIVTMNIVVLNRAVKQAR